MIIKRNILLNPGPATTTDTVKTAQIVPDICPREKEFSQIMKDLQSDLLKIVHADPDRYTAVLFCGSGTLNLDVCINSLIPQDKTMLIVNNGTYSARGAEICRYYGLQHIDLRSSVFQPPDLKRIEQTLKENSNIAVVYTTHHETVSGLLNPIRKIGEMAHQFGCAFIVDTTSSLAMIPIDMAKDHIDVCMASAQKGIMAMAGLSFIIGNTELIKKSGGYPKRSYYCNLYAQYEYFEKTGEMRFTPPVQTIYAARQALKEYFTEGETLKWARHQRVFHALHAGLRDLGFKDVIPHQWQAGLVVSVLEPDDPHWSFEVIHDYCRKRGFTIYPGKLTASNTFRLCALGAIDQSDISEFFKVFKSGLMANHITIPITYNE